MTRIPRVLVTILTSALLLASCGGQQKEPAKQPKAAASSSAAASTNESPKQAPEVKKPEERLDVDFVEAKMLPQPKRLPRVRIDVPGIDQFIPSSLMKISRVRYKIGNWNLMPEGSYVQFVLDNKPYQPVTDPKTKVMLEELNGGQPLAEGEHMLAAYVALENGQSIKGTGAIAVRRFWVGKRTPKKFSPSKDALLILGSPYGTYEGEEGDEIIVDWYLLNADMGKTAYSVEVTIEGPGIAKEGIRRVISEWRPWIILSAHEGEYTVHANLIDPDGNTSTTAWNSTTRKFRVKH